MRINSKFSWCAGEYLVIDEIKGMAGSIFMKD